MDSSVAAEPSVNNTTDLSKEQQADDKGESIIHVKVHAPFRVYFDGPALSVSAENNTGPFDILGHHHNFITLLNASDIVIRPLGNQEPEHIRISGGIMHVKEDQVMVFLNV